MKNFWIIVFTTLYSGLALACPGCVGANPQDKYLVYILGGFVLLTYIPFYFLFRMIAKNKNAHIQHSVEESTPPTP